MLLKKLLHHARSFIPSVSVVFPGQVSAPSRRIGARVESLGRRALFLIPSIKVYNRKYSRTRQSIAKAVHHFLSDTFDGYTCASGNIYGYFASERLDYDELREFRVAFKEDDLGTKIPKLREFLAGICEDIGEECIYLELGEDAELIYPVYLD